ncbi:hypothetical protein LCGC14_1596550 [marine sediment metagenome]|uniref:Uncharacterized protein n=1 Tax=marine sediment metagenome TaxID=412755 RepID=A0A0F9KT23_9ZZZZ
MIKQIILFALILVFGIVASTIVHELFHQYKFSEINEICFFGYISDDEFMNSAIGWNAADNYWHLEEKIPTIAGLITAAVIAIVLAFLFRKELRWW